MTTPAIRTQSTSTIGTLSSANSISIPSDAVEGDLVVAVIVACKISTTVTVTIPTGWTQLAVNAVIGMTTVICYAIYTAGLAVAYSISATARITETVYGFGGAGQVPEVSTLASATSNSPNPGAVTPSWASADDIFMAIVSYLDGTKAVTAYPTNYTSHQVNPAVGNANAAGIGVALRALTGTTDDPAAFTLNGTANLTHAYTVAIRGAHVPRKGFTNFGGTTSA